MEVEILSPEDLPYFDDEGAAEDEPSGFSYGNLDVPLFVWQLDSLIRNGQVTLDIRKEDGKTIWFIAPGATPASR